MSKYGLYVKSTTENVIYIGQHPRVLEKTKNTLPQWEQHYQEKEQAFKNYIQENRDSLEKKLNNFQEKFNIHNDEERKMYIEIKGEDFFDISERNPHAVYHHLCVQSFISKISGYYLTRWGKKHPDFEKSKLIYCPFCKSHSNILNFMPTLSGQLYCLSCVTEFLCINEDQLQFCKLQKVSDEQI